MHTWQKTEDKGWTVHMDHGKLRARPHSHLVFSGEEREARRFFEWFIPRRDAFQTVLRSDGVAVAWRGR